MFIKVNILCIFLSSFLSFFLLFLPPSLFFSFLHLRQDLCRDPRLVMHSQILICQPPEHWGYRCVLPWPALYVAALWPTDGINKWSQHHWRYRTPPPFPKGTCDSNSLFLRTPISFSFPQNAGKLHFVGKIACSEILHCLF